MKSKRCTKCNRVKGLSSFYVDNNRVDKRQGYCIPCMKKVAHQFHLENPTYQKEYEQAHAEERAEYSKNWKIKNHKHYIDYQRAHVKNKRKNNIQFRLQENLRARTSRALAGINRSAATLQLIGCTTEQLKAHLQSQFTKGMSWDNYGFRGWHVDHIKPIGKADLLDPVEQSIVFHYSNLQPLWAEDNARKRDKILVEV